MMDIYEFNTTALGALKTPDAVLCACFITASLPGVPMYYFTTAFGIENNLSALNGKCEPRVVNRKKFTYEEISKQLNNPDSDHSKVHSGLEKILENRKKFTLMDPSCGFAVHDSNDKRILCMERKNCKESLFAIANVSSEKITASLPFLKNTGIEKQEISLKPYGYCWLTSKDVFIG